jgi:hypothetical protein
MRRLPNASDNGSSLNLKQSLSHFESQGDSRGLLLAHQNGDAVEVKLSGQRATFIRRQEGMQRPEMGGALRLQPPIDMPKSQ